MPRFMFGTNDEAEARRILEVLTSGSATLVVQGGVAPPPSRPTALPPPVPGGGMPAAPPPPPTPTAPPAATNPRLDNVIRLMDGYAKAGHKVEGVRKVLAMVGLQRAQDADEAQLVWLEQAFANTSWTPPG